ncbi:MAG: D-glycero-beta-D-manno-heptose 1-phosphate adenylyltransferase [Armatimonadota bacterium]|nr:D-glycero-beta-D-manno-heptose 1-phosphate adenylyltransferase [Armatimonadota bacterium]
MDRAAISKEAAHRRRAGQTVVFTNGCFDILHVGHVRYLQAARREGDCLFVGVNSDRSVQELKGPTRPLVSEDERAEILAALSCVDGVCIFDERGSEELIRAIQPAIHVKGGDYQPDDLPEAAVVRSLGITIRMMPLVPGRSTSRLLQLMQGTELEEACCISTGEGSE